MGTYPVAPTATMATIKMNTENVLCDNTEYGDLIDEVIEEYGENMRERFGYDEVTEDYIEECRYYEVTMLDNTEDEALESIITKGNLNARRTAKIIMKMTKTVIDYHEDNGDDLDVSKLCDIGKLYSLWRYVITDAVEWEIEEE